MVIQALSQKVNRQNEISPASGWVWPERGAQPSGGSSEERRREEPNEVGRAFDQDASGMPLLRVVLGPSVWVMAPG